MGYWEFVGRDVELAQIGAAHERGRSAVVVAGGAGVGKTTLARAALDRLAGLGCHRAWITASRSMASIPFGAVAHLIPPNCQPGAGPVTLLRAIADRLAEFGGRRAAVLGVDDANLLDDASASVVGHVIRSGLAFTVLTVRSDDGLGDFVMGLAKEGLADQLDVGGLIESDVDRVIDAWLGGPVDGLSRQRLHQIANGNPFALRELLSTAMRERHGIWQLQEKAGVSDRLGELVRLRLAGLDGETRRVLNIVACGEPVSLSVLERLAEPAAISRAETSGVLVVGESGARVEARISHPLYAEVIRARMPHAGRRDAHRSLAAAVLGAGLRRRDDALRVALWQVDGGDVTNAEVVRRGAVQAVGRADLALAERLARAARTAEPGAESDRLLAEVLGYRGKTDEAADLLDGGDGPPEGIGQVQWAITRAETIYWRTGDINQARLAFAPVMRTPMARASLSWLLFFDGQVAESSAMAASVLTGQEDDPQAAIWATASGAGSAGFLGGDPAPIYDNGIGVARAHAAQMPWGEFEIEIATCLAYLALGDAHRAQQISDAGYRAALNIGVPMMVCGWALYAGLAALARGHVITAETLLREAVPGFAENDTFRLARCCTAALAGVAGLRGETEAAREWITWTDKLETDANRVFQPWMRMWRSWTLLARGEHAEATAQLQEAAGLARALSLPSIEAEALYSLFRQGVPGKAATIRRLHDLALSTPAAAAMADAAKGLSEKDPDLLSTAATAFERLGQDLLAAEAAAAAVEVLRELGRAGPAKRALLRAAELRRRCQGVKTPLLTWAGPADLLSPREREIARLAMSHSSQEIAEMLGLARVTVNNNLARACAKLGVSGRAGLRSMLGDD